MKKLSLIFSFALAVVFAGCFVACKKTQEFSIELPESEIVSVVYDTNKYNTKNSKISIKKGRSFVFSLKVEEGYTSHFAIVKVNGKQLHANSDGLYILEDVSESIRIEVENVVKTQDLLDSSSTLVPITMGVDEKGNLYAQVEQQSENSFLLYTTDDDGRVSKTKIVKANEAVVFENVGANTRLFAKEILNVSKTELNVEKMLINNVYADYYDDEYVQNVSNAIQAKKQNQSSTSPLFIQNPYGTDWLSAYFYFNTAGERSVSYEVVTEGHSAFKRNVLEDFGGKTKKATEHEFAVHGLVSGKTNWVIVNIWNEGVLEQTHCVQCVAPNIEEIDDMFAGKGISKTVYTEDALADGLYAFSFGVERSTADRSTNMAMMDNDGVIRWFVPMNDCFFQNVFIQEYAGQKCFVYAIDYHQIVYVNYLGKVVKKITLDIVPEFSENGTYAYFAMHHDFCFDDQGNIFVLVGRATSRQIEKTAGTYPPNFGNYVVRYNISKDTIEVVLDFNRSVYSSYTTTHEGTLISDWFHPNSVQYAKDSQNEYLTISSRETSSIVKVKLGSVLTAPEAVVEVESEVVWFMSENAKLIDAEGATLLLEKVGAKCLPILGQHTAYIHTTNIFSNRVLQEGQYYLSVFSNNAKVNSSGNVWNIDESIDQTTVGDTAKGLVFLIDEQNKTYELVLEMNFSRSIYMGSLVLLQNGNWQAGSTMDMAIAECTNNGTKIVEFRFFRLAEPDAHIQGLGYRAIKINL